MAANLIYITTRDMPEAERIGRTLVEEHLAACVNIIGGMRSIYRWEGKLEQDSETILIAKTDQVRVAALTERVKELHHADCPCIVALPVQGGNQAFLDWITGEMG